MVMQTLKICIGWITKVERQNVDDTKVQKKVEVSSFPCIILYNAVKTMKTMIIKYA